MADVAHLVRAPGCGSGGSGFETRRLPHLFLKIIFYIHGFSYSCNYYRLHFLSSEQKSR